MTNRRKKTEQPVDFGLPRVLDCRWRGWIRDPSRAVHMEVRAALKSTDRPQCRLRAYIWPRGKTWEWSLSLTDPTDALLRAVLQGRTRTRKDAMLQSEAAGRWLLAKASMMPRYLHREVTPNPARSKRA